MVMVFTLVSYALEWLTTHKEGLARSAKEEKERRKKEQEEAERVRRKDINRFICSAPLSSLKSLKCMPATFLSR